MSKPELKYRPILLKDCIWVMNALDNIDVAKNTSQIPHPLTENFVTDWVQNWINLANEDKGLRIVGRTSNNSGFGSAAFRKTQKNVAEISFWITPSFWRQGMATQIIQEAIKEAHHQQVKELTAGHFIDNLGSQALLKKFSFLRQPKTIKVYSQSRGHTVESVRYSLSLT